MKTSVKYVYKVIVDTYKDDGKNHKYDIHVDFDNVKSSPVYAKLYVNPKVVMLLSASQLKVVANGLSLVDADTDVNFDIFDEINDLRLHVYTSVDDVYFCIGDSSYQLFTEDCELLSKALLTIANSIELTK